MTTAVGPKSTTTLQSPQEFFQNIYIQLKTGQLTAAINALNQGKSTQKVLTEKNVTDIAGFIKGDENDLSEKANEARAKKLVRLIKGRANIFAGVNPDLFNEASSSGPTSTVTSSQPAAIKNSASLTISAAKPSTTDANSKVLEKVKALGKQAGLSDQEVNNALEEIVEDDGSSTWMVKVRHNNPAFFAWQISLQQLASMEGIILFQEGYPNSATSRCLRRFETVTSGLQLNVTSTYRDLVKMHILEKINEKTFICSIAAIFGAVKEDPVSTVKALMEISQKSEIAAEIIKKILGSTSGLPTQDDLRNMAYTMRQSFPNPITWISFYGLLHPVVYKDCDKDTLQVLETMIAAEKKVNYNSKFIKDETYIDLAMNHMKAMQNFIDKMMAPRDASYVSVYRKERPKMPKGKLAFVAFGDNHGPAFKAGLLGLQKTKPEGKHSDKGDQKASVTQTAKKVSGKTETS